MTRRYFDSIKPVSLIAIMLVSLLTAGCSVAPVPIDKEVVVDQLSRDRQVALEGVEPLDGILELEEAVARAIKYNLEYRVKTMEQALALGEFDLSRYDMLPQVLADAGYSTRNKPLIRSQSSSSDSLNERQPTVSSELSSWDFSLGLSWSLLDFGASYYLARQNANNLLVANEQRRRAMHLLIMEVESAYWKAASAQALEEKVKSNSLAIEKAIKKELRAKAEAINTPLESLRRLRALWGAKQTIQDIQDDLVGAKLELANLINLPPGEEPELSAVSNNYKIPDLMQLQTDKIESITLRNNAELAIQSYEVKNAVLETRRAILDLMPGITINWGAKYSTDSYVINDQWNEGALSVTSNLLNFLKLSEVKESYESKEQLARTRRVALQMSTITKLHIARLQLKNAMKRYNISKKLLSLDRSIESNISRNVEVGTNSESELIIAETTALVSQLQTYRDLSNLHVAESRLKASMGLEPKIQSVNLTTLSELTKSIKDIQKNWKSGFTQEDVLQESLP